MVIQHMTDANVAIELFAGIITLLLLACCKSEKISYNKTCETLFLIMLATNFFILICDAFTYIFSGYANLTILLYICNFLVYSLGYVMTALFTWYLVAYISVKRKISKVIVHIISLLCSIAIVLVVVSLFNHMYFSFENGIYIRGDMYWLSQLYPVTILIFDMLLIFATSRSLGFHDTVALLSYGILPAIAMIIQIFVYGIALLYTSTTLSLLIIYITIHAEQGRRLVQREKELTQANISIMLSQIQPHFLYNSLTAISQLCEKDPKQAKNTIIDFSNYLRCNLESLSQIAPVPFETELEHVKRYLSLEKMRFADELNIVYDIKYTNFMLPSLSVQPLVENAVKYGVGNKIGGGTVTIYTESTADYYQVSVTDDGIGFDPDETQYDGRTHIGIDNVRSRIAAQCGGTLEINSIKNIGTTMTINIPKGGRFDENPNN